MGITGRHFWTLCLSFEHDLMTFCSGLTVIIVLFFFCLHCYIVFLLLFYILGRLGPTTSGDNTTVAFSFLTCCAEATKELSTVGEELLLANPKAALAMAH